MLAQLNPNALGISTDWNEVLAALHRGGRSVIVDLAWPESFAQDGRHELVLERLEGDRIYYFNPHATQGLAAGTLLPAIASLPERRVEGTGKESMTLAALSELFAQGDGCALIPV